MEIIPALAPKLYNISTVPKIIEKNPKVMSGQPVIKGTRIPVAMVLAQVGYGYKLSDLKKEFPDLSHLTNKDIAEILSYYHKRFA